MSSPGLRVLGTVAATVDGRPVRLGGPRQVAVLGVLLVAHGQVVPDDALIEAVWESTGPPASATVTLRGYVKKLRKVLEPGRPPRERGRVLVREGSGYALRTGPGAVDSDRFTTLLNIADRYMADERHQAAVTALDEALSLWSGPAYAGFDGEPWALPEVTRLSHLRRVARERRLAARLALGEDTTLIGDLEVLVAEEPMAERAWELLVLAWYRSGRQDAALAALRRARERLAEELGVDPGPSLRRLETAVLNQDQTLMAGRRR
ncbi:AfsR/SARP family transcriptional regulator [Actinocorallia aurantiaca]|uniref:OmpR/PhoB-type domain-containing protein n=1 Tax=Actinocorallia aurantiaca TaxID=46204 RepID=A0ABP6GCH7_9ACTN